jgi:hypothetical protein
MNDGLLFQSWQNSVAIYIYVARSTEFLTEKFVLPAPNFVI